MLLKPKYRTWLGNFPKFRPKNSILFILTENWHTWYIEGADSESGLEIPIPKFIFGQIWVEKVKVVRFTWEMAHMISGRMLMILIPTLVFWVEKPESIFGQIWAAKIKDIHFGCKLAHRVSRRCWFLFRHSYSCYFSHFATLNRFLSKLGLKKSKVFEWKLPHMVYWGCWFSFRNSDIYSFLNIQP